MDAFGAPFISSSASYDYAPTQSNPGAIEFEWETMCNDVRLEPYQIFIRGVDESGEVPSFAA